MRSTTASSSPASSIADSTGEADGTSARSSAIGLARCSSWFRAWIARGRTPIARVRVRYLLTLARALLADRVPAASRGGSRA